MALVTLEHSNFACLFFSSDQCRTLSIRRDLAPNLFKETFPGMIGEGKRKACITCHQSILFLLSFLCLISGTDLRRTPRKIGGRVGGKWMRTNWGSRGPVGRIRLQGPLNVCATGCLQVTRVTKESCRDAKLKATCRFGGRFRGSLAHGIAVGETVPSGNVLRTDAFRSGSI